MSYPNVKLNQSAYTLITQNKTGVLQNCYAPLFNLNKSGLSEFTTTNLLFNRNITEDLLIVDEYDGSSNIVLNDDNNIPRLINTRVSLQENNTFLIPEHSGNAVTNVYEDSILNTQIGLFKLYQAIPNLNFLGLIDGQFPCGSYHFYFKFADADGNVTNIVQHSGLVQMHIGQINSYQVRMGLEDENSGKGVSFQLTNCDAGFDYIRVFFERTSSGEDQSPITTYKMIDQNFPIINGVCDLSLTGAEEQLEITLDDLKSEYADIASAKTQDVAQNILFLANTTAYAHDYKALQQLAWNIYPTTEETTAINDIDFTYSLAKAGSYYNAKNVYNSVGYWSDEFYRFGIVFVYNNNQTSPVFNILGYDEDSGYNPYMDSTEKEFEPNDYIFQKSGCVNSKGVFKTKTRDLWKGNQPSTIGIRFRYKNSSFQQELQKHDIKGYFFVRQKRIPTIIAQGIVIGVTNKKNGSLPILQEGVSWVSKSFLGPQRLLNATGTDIYTDEAQANGLLIPDAELQPLTFNHIFTSQEFSLIRVGKVQFEKAGDWFKVSNLQLTADPIERVSKITAVNKETTVVTDGENYFSTLAGNPAEPYKTVDIENDWDNTAAQNLTLSQTLVRGQFGYYAGLSCKDFSFGDIVNIKKKEFCENKEQQIELEFQNRFTDYNKYSPISTRYNTVSNGIDQIHFGGDCFHSAFTHKMMNNFADTELPTNTKIIDPKCWAKNYAVRTTAYMIKDTNDLPFNCQNSGTEGWSIDETTVKRSADPDTPTYFNQIAEFFEIKQDNSGADNTTYRDKVIDINTFKDNMRLKAPEPVKTGLSIVDATIQLVQASVEEWVPRGSGNINRSDVNAVSFAQWITLPICSSMNLAFRDQAYNNVAEESSFNQKRSFFPLKAMDPTIHLMESDSINFAAKKTISTNQQVAYKTKPFTKQEYFNRIYWSKPNVTQDFINSYRMIFNQQYREYSKEYGAITKILSGGNYLYVVFEHGIGVLEVNRTPQSQQEQSQYLASKSVLPADIQEITADYGSMWKDSVIKTPSGIVYGVDAVAKKIWQLYGTKLTFLSDQKVNKFLNQFITLSEFDTSQYNGHLNVKTHYNEFKHDVIFTFIKDKPTYKISIGIQDALNAARMSELQKLFNIQSYDVKPWTSDGNNIFTAIICNEKGQKVQEDTYVVRSGKIYYNNLDTGYNAEITWDSGTQWSLCYNELQQQFTTFYDWYPYFSENVNNIFFSFDQEKVEEVYANQNKKDRIVVTIDGQAGETFRSNKNSFDNAFNQQLDIQYWYTTNKELQLQITPSIAISNGYLCFYLKGATIEFPALEPLVVQDGYTFYVIKFDAKKLNSSYTVQLKVNSDEILIADIQYKEWNPDDDMGFQYFTLRNSSNNTLYLWKHGQGGLYDNQGKIKPTNWYGKQHEFNFEFVINDEPFRQKIFNNLKMLSNKAEPNKFEFEVVGEGYEWFDYKPIVEWINSQPLPTTTTDEDYWWKFVLDKTPQMIQQNYPDFPDLKYQGEWDNNHTRVIQRLPYLKMKLTDKKGSPERPSYGNDFWTGLNPNNDGSSKYQYNTNEVCLIEDDQLNEQRVHSEQLGNDVKKYGRLRGNMQYLEDLWNVEIRPIKFKWCYLQDGRLEFETKETRHRDKYLKVKVRYSGEDLAIIQAITTMYEISYA